MVLRSVPAFSETGGFSRERSLKMKKKKKIVWLLTAALFVALISASWVQGAEKVNINTATAAQLQTISGIGPTIADRIVKYRDENGPFKTAQDITHVKGIGPKKYEAIKDQVTVK
ncbi:MAG: helix-hairpin-helix domain-containing protein [Deltaproteobacteria bacterium]|nr:helix-hairpin-helix domain-containing protein [Deltaproteobacteria bacterium]